MEEEEEEEIVVVESKVVGIKEIVVEASKEVVIRIGEGFLDHTKTKGVAKEDIRTEEVITTIGEGVIKTIGEEVIKTIGVVIKTIGAGDIKIEVEGIKTEGENGITMVVGAEVGVVDVEEEEIIIEHHKTNTSICKKND
ncbi:hypothetical protein J6590_025533 [Homalodisca vitripennis]|nr:hypothetical protein J6590_025533 [Homalodisca vitripennis]